MNEFLSELEKNLRHMSADEKAEILSDYREHFAIGLACGRTESQIAESLGDPKQLARMYSASKAVETAGATKSPGDILRMVGAVISYKVGGGLMVACLYVIAVSVMISLYAAVFGIMLTGAALAVAGAVYLYSGFVAFCLLAFSLALMFLSGGALGYKGTSGLWRATVGRLPLLASLLTRPPERECE